MTPIKQTSIRLPTPIRDALRRNVYLSGETQSKIIIRAITTELERMDTERLLAKKSRVTS
jgi:predicted DNA-binding protein